LTPAETVFYRCLVELYGTVAVVCPKVRLGDLIQPRRDLDSKRFWSAFNRVLAKHVDFVLLRPEDLTVIGVIELDDRSHERQDRADRDQFVDEALRQGGIPICRIKNRRQYDLNALCQQLNTAFAPPEEKTP
jgi:very-short-patch-repair endonuclease